jgi:hypothetical protein
MAVKKISNIRGCVILASLNDEGMEEKMVVEVGKQI